MSDPSSPPKLLTGWWLGGCLALSGCVWHGPEARHYVGPVWIRQSHGAAEVTQTIHGPLVIEGGRRWGASVGVIRRMSAASQGETRGAGAVVAPDPGRWEFSPLYKQVAAPRPAEFSATTLWGATAMAGTELNALSLGYTRRTEFRPRPDGFYLLNYTFRHPEATELRFDPDQLPGSSETKTTKTKP